VSPLFVQRLQSGSPLTNALPPANTPTNFNFSGVNTDNEISVETTGWAPAITGGLLSAVAVWCYMAGHTAAVNTQGAIWSAGGVLLGNSAVISVAQGSGAGGGQLWTRFPLLAPVLMYPGVAYFPGWFRQSNQDHEWSVYGFGSFSFNTSAALGSYAANACGGAFICAHPGIYIEYDVLPPHRGDQSW
jgi:hypothetical protein